MKRNPIFRNILIFTIVVLLSACTLSESEPKNDSDDPGETEIDEMIFEEEDVDPENGKELIPDEDEMVFDDEEEK